MFGNQPAHPVQLVRPEPVRSGQLYPVQPVFSSLVTVGDVDAGRLAPFEAVEDRAESLERVGWPA